MFGGNAVITFPDVGGPYREIALREVEASLRAARVHVWREGDTLVLPFTATSPSAKDPEC